MYRTRNWTQHQRSTEPLPRAATHADCPTHSRIAVRTAKIAIKTSSSTSQSAPRPPIRPYTVTRKLEFSLRKYFDIGCLHHTQKLHTRRPGVATEIQSHYCATRRNGRDSATSTPISGPGHPLTSEFPTVTSSSQPEKPGHTADDSAQQGESSGLPQITSEELLGDRQEIEIRHSGESYRLRITKNGKLILHK